MKNSLLLILCLTLSSISCSKDDKSSDDITLHDWNLISIKFENQITIIPQKDFFNDNAYILKFSSQSAFSLNTSVNGAIGNYSINHVSNKIIISDYHEITEVGETSTDEKTINNLLIQLLNNATSFNVNLDDLILFGENEEFVFKKNK
tara:strand:- start:613 stop:1056 length:444 start_codon:yes stop_codon:yes gene_type:complete